MRAVVAIAITLAVAIPAKAYDFAIDGIYYNILDETAKTVEVTYHDSKSNSYSGDIVIPSIVKYSDTEYSVTKIGDYAFYAIDDCTGLTSIALPSSITSIGEYAFWRCGGLESIVVNSGNQYYDSRDGCNAIIETSSNTLMFGCENTKIPSSVTSIGSDAFNDCTGLTTVIIPNSVTSIGRYAFYGCTGLTSIKIPDSVIEIGPYAFRGCKKLVSVEIGNSVESIEERTFYNCIELTTVVLGSSVSMINDDAFGSSPNIKKIVSKNTVPPVFGNTNSFETIVYGQAEVYVPMESLETYKNDDSWELFSNIYGLEASGEVSSHVMLSIAYPEGGVVKHREAIGETAALAIIPSSGWMLNSVTLDGADVTDELDASGNYTTPVLLADAVLSVVFEKSADGSITTLSTDDTIRVYASDGVVTIVGADEFADVRIVDIGGAVVYSGTEKRIALDGSGVYLLTVGGRVFKFAL